MTELQHHQYNFSNLAAKYYTVYGDGREKQAGIVVADPAVVSNPLLNIAVSGGITLGALGLAIPGYRFVRGMRKGYKERVDGLSDLTRASQALEATRKTRDYDYLAPRAILKVKDSE